MTSVQSSRRARREGRWVVASLTALTLSACSGDVGAPGTEGAPGADGAPGTPGEQGPAGSGKSLHFTPINLALTPEQKRSVAASPQALVNGERVSLGYETVLRSGQKLGEHVFGRLTNKTGAPVTHADGSDFISPSNDFSALLPVGGKLFELTQFETTPAAMYLSELSQDATGKLSAVSTRPIDFSGFEGYWIPCAGSVSPWNTNLSSEEYPADARAYEAMSAPSSLNSDEKAMLRYWGLSAATATMEQVRAVYSPYRYGYVVEVSVDATGKTQVQKHYAAGRRALELAKVMPDQRTVYLSDDGTNDAFYMFVAKRAGDLSEGQLYAARWYQTSLAGQPNGRAELSWIALGPSATDAEVKALLDRDIHFSDIFETSDAPDAAGDCAATGFKPLFTETGRECLKLKPGQELAASRLESRRYAAYLGATTEFRKTEGITYNPATHRLYVSFSEVNRGMTDAATGATPRDLPKVNHVRLAENYCGAVYEMVLSPNAKVGSDYVAESAASLIEGVWLANPAYPRPYPADSDYFDPTFTLPNSTTGAAELKPVNVCSVNGIANPDNLAFIEGYDTLIIGEDSTDGHQNDMVWSYNVVSRELTRILSTPYGSETTGVYFYPNLNGHAYIKTQIQHPYGESDTDKAGADTSMTQSYTGYIGPFPAMN